MLSMHDAGSLNQLCCSRHQTRSSTVPAKEGTSYNRKEFAHFCGITPTCIPGDEVKPAGVPVDVFAPAVVLVATTEMGICPGSPLHGGLMRMPGHGNGCTEHALPMAAVPGAACLCHPARRLINSPADLLSVSPATFFHKTSIASDRMHAQVDAKEKCA